MIQADGLAIARERIAEEAKARTGFLDLGQLGLTELPEELFTLKHLHRLNLGSGMLDEDEQQWLESSRDITPNDIESSLERLNELPELRALSVNSCRLASLSVVADLAGLRAFDCSSTQVSDLAPLAGLSALQTLYCFGTQVSDLAPLAGLGALQTLYCSSTQVSDLAPLASLGALQTLDCSSTQVSDLTPLASLSALQTLYCFGTQVSDLAPLAGLSALQTLDCSSTQVSDLTPLASLGALQTLNCSSTQVSDLTPLASLGALQTLYCSSTQVSDLAPLASLSALQTLYCSSTQVSDLTPLASLSALQTLYCSSTQVSDLTPLASLSALQTLNCSSTQVSDLAPLASLSALQTLNCSSTQVSDLAPLAGLSALQTLDCSSTQVSDLTPLASLGALQTLNCSSTQVSDLTPLASLGALQTLYCSSTQVSDLAPLASLSALQTLYCFGTQVSDLTPLASLSALQTLYCFGTQVSDLTPLAGLSALQTLYCFGTQVSDLTPLAGLSALQTLDCFRTRVSDLTPLASLGALQTLNCSSTQVSDLTPLASLGALQTLNCSSTQVSDLTPLASLGALQTLNCSSTQVSDLTPLASLSALQTLNCSGCSLADFPRWLLQLPSLKELVLYECRLPNVPAAVLSQSYREDCLEALRAHVRDLEAGSVAVSDVKLMVLGNGRVGKTQLCRRLRGEVYDETVPSTHGVLVTSAPLPSATDGPAARLQIWDFGGQDIYHGTHALFMRTSAIFLLIWTPVLEDAQEHVHDGMVFRNHPLAYWVDYVRHLGGAGSPVLVVQTRCDRPEDEATCPVPEADLFEASPFRKVLRYSARTDRGRAALDEALAEAADWLRQREGIAVIGVGRHSVQQRLEAMRDAHAVVALEARQYRTITQAHFHRLCDEASGISSPDHLLAYLNNAGVVFYRPGLFGDEVILDQGWALDAIYAVFHREKCYGRIRRQQGRFTRSDLEDWVWRERGHSVEEQKLFLSMMQSCGICFEHRRSRDGSEAEYIAPDLLPARADLELELEQLWEAAQPTEAATFEYAILHPGLMRSIISRIGGKAGIAAEYWKGGVYVYERETRSRALIEEEMIDAWRGRIRVQTQRGQAAVLLKRLRALVEEEQNQAGLTPVEVRTTADKRETAIAVSGIRAADLGGEAASPAALSFGQEPSSAPEWCVSYAWGDDTPAGRDRTAIVDRLCAEAGARGIRILRDKDALGLGERISKFMKRIGGANRVFVVLSDKYLKSPFCMFELSEVWRTSRQEDEEFLKRIRVYALPCATIWTPLDRSEYAVYWKKQYKALETLLKEHGYDILGDIDAHQFRLMKEFSLNVGNILATVADILQPRSFDDLMAYGFDG